MSLYAIGDLHLHFQAVLKAPAQLHDRVWKNHEEKFRKNCEKLVGEDDTLVLVGDHSWGRSLPECEEDLAYIRNLPGRKILTRGNHDMHSFSLTSRFCRTATRPTGITHLSGRRDSPLKDRFILIGEAASSAGTKKRKSMQGSL